MLQNLLLIISSYFVFIYASENFPLYNLPEIKFTDLLTLNELTIERIVTQLTSVGAVQISEIPKFSEARIEALHDAGDCLQKEVHAEKRIMNDGSIRYSTGAATINGIRQPMDNHCGDKASRLRSLVDATCHQLFVALDSKIKESGPVMQPSYQSFSQLIDKGSHLEHLHSYFPSHDSTSSASRKTMDFHTDAGLMIAMTTGHFSNGVPSTRSGLYLSIPDGQSGEIVYKASMLEDSLIILMGEGAKNWLNPVLGKAFRPVPHALIVDFLSGELNSRSWFGKMYLPPADAILPMEQMAYSSYRQYESDFQSNKNSLSLGCGGSASTNIILQNQVCEKNGVAGVYCWTQCQSVADLSCGQDAVCVNTNTGEIVEDGVNTHCMATDGSSYCELQCASPDTNVTTFSDYCYGYGTTMSMTGFFSIVQSDKGSTPCVNLLFDTWTLDNETKFAFACLGVFALGLLIQYITVLRAQTKAISDPMIRRLAKILYFGAQVVLSYFLMLVAMTYSVELFCMVAVGLTVGYGLFHSGDETDPNAIAADSCCPAEKGYDRLADDVINPI